MRAFTLSHHGLNNNIGIANVFRIGSNKKSPALLFADGSYILVDKWNGPKVEDGSIKAAGIHGIKSVAGMLTLIKEDSPGSLVHVRGSLPKGMELRAGTFYSTIGTNGKVHHKAGKDALVALTNNTYLRCYYEDGTVRELRQESGKLVVCTLKPAEMGTLRLKQFDRLWAENNPQMATVLLYQLALLYRFGDEATQAGALERVENIGYDRLYDGHKRIMREATARSATIALRFQMLSGSGSMRITKTKRRSA